MLPKNFADAPRVFHGVRFDVHAVQLPGGAGGAAVRREVIVHPGAVLILPVLEAGDDPTLVMIHNERFAVGQTLYELPAGTLEPAPETPQSCAARELIEETGYRAAVIDPLMTFYTTPGFCTEKMYCYVASGLTHVGQDLDESERIEVHTMKLSRVLAMIRAGEITDGKTIAALLYFHTFGNKSKP